MKLTKLTSIGLLMVVSELLMAAFVVQWLFAQYNQEKNSLETTLYRQFTDSRQQAMDTLILVNLIDPVLKSKDGFKVHLEIDHDTLSGKKSIHEFLSDTVLIKHKNTFRPLDTINENFDRMITIKHEPDSAENNLLLHGVKMFVKKITASGNGKDSIQTSFFYNTDTLLLKKIVAENFSREGYPFRLKWISDRKKDSTVHASANMYFESNLFPDAYGLEISHYNFFILRKISPQFLFGFILIVLTGIAFLVAHRSLQKQTRLNLLKSDFISNISHELKTPVSTVKVAIEALQNNDMKGDARIVNEYLDIASQELNRLDLFINMILNTSLLEDDKHFIRPEQTNLNSLITETLNTMQVRILNQQATIKFNSEENCTAPVDRQHIQGVLINLIDNSLKYAVEKHEIEIRLYESTHRVCIALSDNGPGIPAEYLKKVFDKFFRVPTSNLHNVKGYGLGLSYASMVMTKHHGSIEVKNNDTGGCVFTLVFPKSA